MTAERRVQWTAYALLVASAGWLATAAVLVDLEYYDGLSAISNARYFLGRSAFYVFDRGPLMGWVLMPAEAVKGWFGLDPLGFRPHHATLALVHAGYLVVVYRVLSVQFGPTWSTLCAFATAVTSFAFFSYAPFLSHDLAPGAVLLLMLVWSEQLARSRRPVVWLLLVAAGTVAPLVKQTYGVFWIAVIGAHTLPTLLRMDAEFRTPRRTLMWLSGGAAVSGLLTWTVYGLVLANWIPDVDWWLRPFRNLQYLGSVYDGTDVQFPVWIYLRNLWAYGRLTTLLLLTGLLLSLRGSVLQRRVALAWTIAVVFVHALPLREVRYLAFLAPLSAFMIVPAVRMLAQRRLGVAVIAALLLLDLAGAVSEASRIGTSFYRRNELRGLLEPLLDGSRVRTPIFHNLSMLSFVAPGPSPLAADRYHRVFHVGLQHIGVLLEYDRRDIRNVAIGPAAIARAPEGSVLLFSSHILAYGPTWDRRPPSGHESFAQGAARLTTLTLHRQPDGTYGRPDRSVERALQLRVNDYLMPVAVIGGDQVYALQQTANGGYLLRRSGDSGTPETLLVRTFVIERLSAPPAMITKAP